MQGTCQCVSPPVQILLEKLINLGFPAGQKARGNTSVSHGLVCPSGEGKKGLTLHINVVGTVCLISWGPLKAQLFFLSRTPGHK